MEAERRESMEGMRRKAGRKVRITCKERWMMEASRGKGLRYSEEKSREKGGEYEADYRT